MKQTLKLTINENFNQVTLKDYLKFFHVGRGVIEKLRVSKAIKVNDQVVNNFDHTYLKTNDKIVIDYEDDYNVSPYNYPLDILYEDDNYLILNKPSGILVHSDGTNNHTLQNAVCYYYKAKNESIIARCGHRLDVETSGIIVFVKNFLAGSYFDYLLASGKVNRKYLALVSSLFEKKNGTITYKIGRDRHNAAKYRVSSSGVEAVTNYKVIQSLKNISLVELSLKTGRTHQIRVHMSYLKHPLLGDKLYDGDMSLIRRVALHSYFLYFYDEIEGKDIKLKIELPTDMKKII